MITRTEAKKWFKVALFLYLSAFLIINWDSVSWVFNYQEVGGLVSDFFNPYPSISQAAMEPYFFPNHSTKTGDAVAGVKPAQTNQISNLEIPALNLNLPIVFASSTVEADLMKDLDKGVVFYPGSVYPGQVGQMIILGHSAPPGWPHIKHDWAFSDLQKLQDGDRLMVDVNNQQYTYVVKKTSIIKRGADIPQDTLNNNVLTLVSCWPPGKDYQRIAVEAVLQN